MQLEERTARAVRTGAVVFLALAVLTVIEYLIAIEVQLNMPALVVIAIAKAAAIVYYFMHVVRAWRAHGGEG
jgi:caa(3)-type oxidase subunit IV